MELKNIKIVREKTSAPISKVKEALAATGEDIEQAIAWLGTNWKPKDKESAFGKIYTYNHNGRLGTMLELRCGTDFVARTDDFNILCHDIALQIIAGLDGELEKQIWIKDSTKTIQNLLDELSKKTGEAIKVGRHIRWEIES